MTEDIHSKYERVTGGRKLFDRNRLEARISQLQANNAALMEVVRVVSAWRLAGISDAWAAKTEICRAFSALPAHLKEEASK